MGVFDNFIHDQKCPKCNTDTHGTLQVKELFNTLRTFEIGETVDDDTLLAKDGAYRGIEYCSNCDALLYAYVVIENGVYKDITRLQEEKPFDRMNIMLKEPTN